MKIFDLHAHILPGVDDGAVNIEHALQMLRNAIASDVTAIAATPHCNVPDVFENFRSEQLTKRFEDLQQAAHDLPIRLVLGAEVRVTAQLPELLQEKRIPTLNGSRYLLTEFPTRFSAEDYEAVLDAILDAGYIPLIAHPERYAAVCHDPRITEEWLDKGCHLQITGGSVMGNFGQTVKRTADTLIRNDLVCCIGSDAHDPTHRSNYLSHVYDHLSLYCSKRYADILMWENPLRICSDEHL